MSQILEIINRHKFRLIQSKQQFEGIYFSKGKFLRADDRFISLLDKINSKIDGEYSIDIQKDEYYLGFMFGVRGCILNEYGIQTIMYDKNAPSVEDYMLVNYFPWNDLKSVSINTSKKDPPSLELTTYYNETIFKRGFRFFGTNNKTAIKKVEVLFNEIINSRTVLSQHYLHFSSLLYKGEYEEILSDLEVFRKRSNFSLILDTYHKFKTEVFIELKKYKQALASIENYFSYCDNHNKKYSTELVELKGRLDYESGNYIQAVNSYLLCLTVDDLDEESFTNFSSGLNESYELLLENFSKSSFESRRYLFISDDLHYSDIDGLVILKNDNLPKNIKFPLSHPKLNELYINHPINKNSYLPVKDYESALYVDKLREFQILMDSLGAKRIDIIDKSNFKNSVQQNSHVKMNGGLKVKSIGVAGSYEKNRSGESQLQQELNMAFHQELNPKKAPFIPENLVWFDSNLNWQRLAQQRLNGSLLKHREIISSNEITSLSSQELTSIYAELSVLVVKANFGHEEMASHKSRSEISYILEFHIEFEEMDNLKATNNISVNDSNVNAISENLNNNDSIEKYIEDVLFMLEEGREINELERKLLNRNIKRYGLTQEQADQIEKDLMFTEVEVMYLEEYEMFFEEGEIGELERNMLNRYAKRYNIDEERQKVLEITFNKN